jgi:hypothetical protein
MAYDIFHTGARVFCVNDTVSAPIGEGEIIQNYADGLLDRVSLKLVVRGNDMNWVAVNSEDFASVCFDSQSFFEKNLVSRLRDSVKLKTLVDADRNLSPVERRVGLTHLDYFHSLKDIKGRRCVSSNPHESLSRMMQPKTPYYLEDGAVQPSFVAYRLDWR